MKLLKLLVAGIPAYFLVRLLVSLITAGLDPAEFPWVAASAAASLVLVGWVLLEDGS